MYIGMSFCGTDSRFSATSAQMPFTSNLMERFMPRPASNAAKTNTEKNRKATTPKQPIVSRTKNDNEPKSPAKVVKASQLVITEDDFRARIAAKAYELYAHRQAITETDDWLQAERLVKEELLAEGHHAGSV